jgi:hypothetical protein
MKRKTTLLALGTLCLSLACNEIASSTPNAQNPNFAELLPPGTHFIEEVRLDTDGDGSKEWILFYHFDLMNDERDPTDPVGGVVYRSLEPTHFDLVAHCLLPNSWCFHKHCDEDNVQPVDNRYLCNGECTASMEEIITQAPGKELVIKDKNSPKRVAIFSWDPQTPAGCSEGHYDLRGQFCGDRVIVGEQNPNTVAVDKRSQEFALFAMRLTYSTGDTGSFYEIPNTPPPNGYQVPLRPPDYEVIMFPGECDNVMHSPYPEKTVMAFYSHYNEETAQKYFADGKWEQLEGCADQSGCGCSVPPEQVERVQVKEQPESSFLTQNDATVLTQVKCTHKDGNTDPEILVTWSVKREGDGQWKITGIVSEEPATP